VTSFAEGEIRTEIARNIQQAAGGTRRVSSNIMDVRREAAETGSASSRFEMRFGVAAG
jgi:hypothetical protein